LDIGAYIRIIRPSSCILIASTALLGQILAIGILPEPIVAVKAILSGFLLTASSFTLNDYVDHEVDAINTPLRPIPSGRITRHESLRYGIALGIAGATATLLLNINAAILGLSVYLLTIFYTVKAKIYGFIGNIIVALCIASYFIFGYLSIKTYIDPYIASISCICFFYVLGGEVAQSIADAEGDKLRGVKSITLFYGSRVAAIVASICYVLMAVMGAYTALRFGFKDNAYSLILVPLTILIVGIITVPLLRKPNKKSAIRTRNLINTIALIIITGFFVILIGYKFT
jgi:geranylgeranylglycerol-phosphate geranylgeranyltransferase